MAGMTASDWIALLAGIANTGTDIYTSNQKNALNQQQLAMSDAQAAAQLAWQKQWLPQAANLDYQVNMNNLGQRQSEQALASTQMDPYFQQKSLGSLQFLRQMDPNSIDSGYDPKTMQGHYNFTAPSFNQPALSDEALLAAAAAFGQATGQATGGKFTGTPLTANFGNASGAQAAMEAAAKKIADEQAAQQKLIHDTLNNISTSATTPTGGSNGPTTDPTTAPGTRNDRRQPRVDEYGNTPTLGNNPTPSGSDWGPTINSQQTGGTNWLARYGPGVAGSLVGGPIGGVAGEMIGRRVSGNGTLPATQYTGYLGMPSWPNVNPLTSGPGGLNMGFTGWAAPEEGTVEWYLAKLRRDAGGK